MTVCDIIITEGEEVMDSGLLEYRIRIHILRQGKLRYAGRLMESFTELMNAGMGDR